MELLHTDNLTYSQLLEENRRLREEVGRLKQLLGSHGIEWKEAEKPLQERRKTAHPTGRWLSLEEKVALFRSLFKGREDVFARRWHSKATDKGGYQPVCLNEWRQGLCDKRKHKCAACPNRQFKSLAYEDVYRHLEGRSPDGQDVIGTYAILEDNTCHFLCADFDDKSCEHGYQEDVHAYTTVCQEWGVPCSVERSRSGNGAHVWVFFAHPVPAAKARRLGNAVLTEAMNRSSRLSFKSYDRFFPNQDHLPQGGLGNLVALPLQGQARRKGNSVFVDGSFEPYPDQWAFLENVKRMAEDELDRQLQIHNQPEFGLLSTTSEEKPWETPRPQQVTAKDFPQQLAIVKANMLYLSLDGLSTRLNNHFKRLASFKNPEFFAKQGMRLSTYNVPRIISCAEQSDDYLVLPRGCEDAVKCLAADNGIPLHIEDKTMHGHPVKLDFKGELRTEQKEAVTAMLAHDCGVLHATTAFGKTVAAIALIAERKTNTLVLVHTKALLDQWKERLTTFLSIDYQEEETSHKRGRKKAFSPFGTLDARGNTLHGQVDIALLQSCVTDNEVKPFVRDYGMVIVDECHHVSAVNFERVLRFANARYVYGLTATPIRKDGHQPIIFMQCGPIRYSANARQQMAGQSFQRYLVPRFTSYRPLMEAQKSYAQTMQDLAQDESRNALIIKDILQAVAERRHPIILTSLTAHVTVLAEMLQQKGMTIVTLVGSESTKTKKEKAAQLQATCADTPSVIVATGRYVGEGFDLPWLDTLFLALPVSWKGLVAQYAGRLHRESVGKRDVRVYDYIDFRIPLCDTMYKRRLKGYAAIGYQLFPQLAFGEGTTSPDTILNGTNYLSPLLADLQNARHSVVFSTCRLYLSARSSLLSAIKQLLARGITVIVVSKQDGEKEKALKAIGADIMVSESVSMNTAVIDRALVWYGSINYLGYTTTTDDSAIRLHNTTLATELLDRLLPGKFHGYKP